MIILIILLITRSFYFLKMFPTMTSIVVMVWHVIKDLRYFLFLYGLFIFIISQVYAVLGLGNEYDIEVDAEEYLEPTPDDLLLEDPTDPIFDRKTFFAVGLHFGYFIQTLKLSMGDFTIIKPVV